MPKYFMHGTLLEETEREMMRAPNFPRRGRGMAAINKFNFRGENSDCGYFAGSKKHAHPDSITFKQNPEATDISHIELVRSCFSGIGDISFKYRIERLRECFGGDMFQNGRHRRRLQDFITEMKIDEECAGPVFIASAFILTSNDSLWLCAKSALTEGGFDFARIKPKGVDTSGYALYKTAKTIYTGTSHIMLNELCDEELVKDRDFVVAVNGILIARYGVGIFFNK